MARSAQVSKPVYSGYGSQAHLPYHRGPLPLPTISLRNQPHLGSPSQPRIDCDFDQCRLTNAGKTQEQGRNRVRKHRAETGQWSRQL